MTDYIGIDVGKETCIVYGLDNNKTFSFPNNTKGLQNLLLKILKMPTPPLVVFEPTGGYERPLRLFLQEKEIAFTIVHPNKVRYYARAKGLLAKTDKIDAKIIADYAAAFNLEHKSKVSSPDLDLLRDLFRRRQTLMNEKTRENNRLDKNLHPVVEGLIKESLVFINSQIETVNNYIQQTLINNPELQRQIKQLTSIPGVGMQLALTILVDLPEAGRIDFKHLTSLVGLAPYAKDSGRSCAKRHIFQGRALIRKILYMATVASLRVNRKIKTFYQHLLAKHKMPKVALVACMRKMLTFIHALLKNKTFWKEETYASTTL